MLVPSVTTSIFVSVPTANTICWLGSWYSHWDTTVSHSWDKHYHLHSQSVSVPTVTTIIFVSVPTANKICWLSSCYSHWLTTFSHSWDKHCPLTVCHSLLSQLSFVCQSQLPRESVGYAHVILIGTQPFHIVRTNTALCIIWMCVSPHCHNYHFCVSPNCQYNLVVRLMLFSMLGSYYQFLVKLRPW